MSVRQQKERSRASAALAGLIWCALLLSAPAGITQTLAKPVITPVAPPPAASTQVAPAVDADANTYIIGADDSLQVDLQRPFVECLAKFLAARPDLRADHIADAVEIDRLEAEGADEILDQLRTRRQADHELEADGLRFGCLRRGDADDVGFRGGFGGCA